MKCECCSEEAIDRLYFNGFVHYYCDKHYESVRIELIEVGILKKDTMPRWLKRLIQEQEKKKNPTKDWTEDEKKERGLICPECGSEIIKNTATCPKCWWNQYYARLREAMFR